MDRNAFATDPYVVTCLLGRAGSEERKLCLWPQWEPCRLLLDPLFQPFVRTSALFCDLVFEVPLAPLRSDPPGTRRVTYRRVPLGRLRWTAEDHRTWSERPLLPAPHPIRVVGARMVSSRDARTPPQVQVHLVNGFCAPEAAHDQVLALTVSEAVFAGRSGAFWDDLVEGLAACVQAVRVGRTVRPWWLERPRGALTEGSSLADARFATRYDRLDLDETWQTWETLR